MKLSEFLLARIAEDEERADRRTGYQYADSFVTRTVANIKAECEAKRRIVERHTVRKVSPSCSECGGYTATSDDVRGIVHHGYAVPWPCPTLRILGVVYSDHPDYRDEWRP